MKRDINTNQNNSDQRSAELEEILFNNPSFLIRYGTIIICTAMVLLISLSLIVQYPDTVAGMAILTPENPVLKVKDVNLNPQKISNNNRNETNDKVTDITSGKLNEEGKYFACIKLPSDYSKKIKPGQIVKLKFYNQIKKEYAHTSGIISSISLITGDKNLIAYAELPNVLVTNSGLKQKITGKPEASVEILTDKKSLFERIFGPLLNIFSNSQK
jgi:hypothetical protein